MGGQIAFTMTDPKTDAAKDRDKKYGEFEVVDQEYRMAHLYVVAIAATAGATAEKPRRLTSGSFTVGSFEWSPDGKSIAFDHRSDTNAASSGSADVSIVTVADGSIRKLVTQNGPDSNPKWSPDGSQIAFESAMANPWSLFLQFAHRDRTLRRRLTEIRLRRIRRAAVAHRVDTGRHSLSGTRENELAPLQAEPVHVAVHRAQPGRRDVDGQLQLQS